MKTWIRVFSVASLLLLAQQSLASGIFWSVSGTIDQVTDPGGVLPALEFAPGQSFVANFGFNDQATGVPDAVIGNFLVFYSDPNGLASSLTAAFGGKSFTRNETTDPQTANNAVILFSYPSDPADQAFVASNGYPPFDFVIGQKSGDPVASNFDSSLFSTMLALGFLGNVDAPGTLVPNTDLATFVLNPAQTQSIQFELDGVSGGNTFRVIGTGLAVQITVVPEAGSLVLCGLAGLSGLGLAVLRRRRG